MNTVDKKSWRPLAKRILSLLGVVAGVFALLFVFLALARYFAPLLVAIVLTMLMEPLVRLLTATDKAGKKRSKYGLPRFIAVIISMMVVVSALALLVLLLVNSLVGEIGKFAAMLPGALPGIYATIQGWAAWAQENIELLPPQAIEAIMTGVSNIGSKLVEGVTSLAGTTVSYATSLPGFILFVVFTVMSTYFVAVGRHRYRAYIINTLPRSWVKRFSHMYKTMISALLGYMRAQLIIMCGMSILLALGFAILGVDYVILMALLIALADALPGIGTGAILLPWGLYNLLFANFTLGVGLLVLYLCAVGLRQIMEPRVLSQQIGMHPLLTMSAMYAGLRLMGVLGMLVGPVTVIILKYVVESYLNGRTLKEYLNVD